MSRMFSFAILAIIAVVVGVSLTVFAPSRSTSQQTSQVVGRFAFVLDKVAAGDWVPNFCVNVDAVKSARQIKVIASAGHVAGITASHSRQYAYCGTYYAPQRAAKPQVAYMRLLVQGRLLAQYWFWIVPPPVPPR
jgi:hypothetical protein